MKKCFFLLVVFLFSACNDEFVDKRIEAYSKAKARVGSAVSSEELVRVSYDLFYELELLDASSGSLDSVAALALKGDEACKEQIETIDNARIAFEEELLQKQMEFYMSMNKKNKR